MNVFLAVSLYAFSACAGLGMLAAAAAGAKEDKPGPAIAAVIIATYVAYVLAASAVKLW